MHFDKGFAKRPGSWQTDKDPSKAGACTTYLTDVEGRGTPEQRADVVSLADVVQDKKALRMRAGLAGSQREFSVMRVLSRYCAAALSSTEDFHGLRADHSLLQYVEADRASCAIIAEQ